MSRHRRFAHLAVALVVASSAAITLAPRASSAPPPVCTERADGGAATGYALTADQRLICFKLNRPSANTTLLSTRRLVAPDTALFGIDVRPANGMIYGIGNAGGIYLLDPNTPQPQFKARMSVSLEGSNIGMDFNPTVDRLRIVTDSGQNLRVNVDTGATTVDALVRNGAVRANGVGGVAYTNNDNDPATATTLYDLDALNDRLSVQNPPNDGVLAPVGPIGFPGSTAVAFDIWSELKDGKAVNNVGYAALDGGGVLFRIDLTTGTPTFLSNTTTPWLGLTFA